MRAIPQPRFWALAITSLLVLGGALSKAHQTNTKESIRIGVFLDLSGQTASFGKSTLDGIKLATDEINTAGGLLGRRVDLIVEDDRGVLAEIGNAATRLIQTKKAHALVGEVASSLTISAALVAQENKVPLVTPASSHPKVTTVGDYIFRACFIDPLQGEALAEFARRDLKTRRAALLTDANSDYSKSLTIAFEKRFVELGGKVVVKKCTRREIGISWPNWRASDRSARM